MASGGNGAMQSGGPGSGRHELSHKAVIVNTFKYVN